MRIPASIKKRIPSRVKTYVSLLRQAKNITCNSDGMITTHICDFPKDPRFLESLIAGAATGAWGGAPLLWRAYVACWAADNGRKLSGDFVECGVNRGGLSKTVMHYIGFKSLENRKFYLLDTFSGPPEEFRHLTAAPNRFEFNEDVYDQVMETFREFKNAVVIRGKIPESLTQVKSEQVCYLSIDMNCAKPEIAAAEYFWDRLVTGASIVLDDYAYGEAYRRQKIAFDEFGKKRDVPILTLPTGQGLIIKPK